MRLVGSLVLVFAACGPSVTVTELRALPPQPRATRAADQVPVLMTGAPPGAIELFSIKADGGIEGRRLGAVRRRAGELGCDAVVITTSVADTEVTGSASGPKSADDTTYTARSYGYVTGVCVLLPPIAPGASSVR
jgi:hypothetical protein